MGGTATFIGEGSSKRLHFGAGRTGVRRCNVMEIEKGDSSQGGGWELLPNEQRSQRSQRRNTEGSLWIC